jgi:hypothetical protein
MRRLLRPESPVPTVVGLAIAAVGFVLILVGWARLADETAVALQLPYVVSGAVVGLGLVMVGLTIVTVQSKRRDAAVLHDQLEELNAVLGQLGPSAQ